MPSSDTRNKIIRVLVIAFIVLHITLFIWEFFIKKILDDKYKKVEPIHKVYESA